MRCFLAVWPTSEVLDALAALPRRPVPGLRWTERAQWHVTLRFFGELGPAELSSAAAASARAAQALGGPLEARGGPRARLWGRDLIVWPVAGLEVAAKLVAEATCEVGRPPPERPFKGHLTIGRAQRGARLPADPTSPLSASWAVAAFSLVRSELHPSGARYHELETFPIGASTNERVFGSSLA